MKKLLFLLALIPALVFAQSYPSPTYNNVTVNGTSTLTGAVSGAGVTSLFASPPAIGGTSASTGAFTTLSGSGVTHLSNTSSGASVLWLTGNGVTTPSKFLGVQTGLFTIQNNAQNSNIFTLTDAGNLSVTGSITPSSTAGLVGTTTNDSPAAGSVGENPSNSTSGTSVSTNTATNCTSVSLTAGNWFVWGTVTFVPSAVLAQVVSSISTTSATLGSTLSAIVASFTSAGQQALPAPPTTLKLASTTTVFLIGQAQITSGTLTCTGQINAIRIR